MTEQALDRLIHGVILDTARLEYGVLLEEAPEHTFSPAFERRMKKLLRRGRHPVWYKSLHAAACVLLALLLSGCAVLAVSPEAREVFAGWVREIHDNYFLYEFLGNEEREAVSKEEVLYQPTYVPAGYRIENRSVFSVGIVSVSYIDDQTGNIAEFTYFSDMSSPILQIAGENEIIYQKVQVNGFPADLYLDSEEGEANAIVWVDERNGAAFRIGGIISGEELVCMAESVEAVPRNVRFCPSWLPEGYDETSAQDCPAKGDNVPRGLDAGKSVLTYEDGKGGRLTITYAQEFDITGLRPDKCEADAVSVLVGGDQAFLFLGQEDHHLVWVDGESGVFFWISGPFTGEELIRIGEGMRTAPQEVMFYPSWLPEGYYETTTDDLRRQSILRYEDGKGGLLTILHPEDFDPGTLMLVGEAEIVSVFVGENPADLYLDRVPGNANNLVWVDQDTGILYWISGPLTGEELVRVAESMEKREEPPPLEEYWLTWTPYGYQEAERSLRENRGHVLYRDEKGRQITLAYRRGSETASLQISSTLGGTMEARPVTVDGAAADLYLEETQEAGNALVWARDGLLFWMIAPCSQEELTAMAESVEVLPVEYKLTWAPEGYELYLQNDTFGHTFTFLYKNPEGNMMCFLYQPDKEKARMYLVPNEDSTEKQVSVKGNPGDLYLAKPGGPQSELVWWDSEMEALCTISASVSEEDILKMAESIEAAAPSPKVRQPSWIPMGYHYAGGSSGSSSMECRYKNENSDEFLFVFLGPPEAEEKEKLRETVKGLESQSVLVNGQAAELYSAADGVLYLVWNGQEPGEVFWLSAALDAGTLIQIAESVFYPS
ncbi:DUF4367 domain-containing protein [uncultured Oscillibacter sp.]|uniref:DUF4367 domain-containing protein n=1 Tax=uncultured Oscillibacter sp. TaxID=876091 RepID=UPI0025F4CE32|nr:DUF4367 domain-containing protein [uncultured Oscillibacter sp.]